MKKTILYFGSLCLLFSVLIANQTAFAESPSFTYVELEYIAAGDFEVSRDTLSANVDLDGFALSASVELGIFILQASRFELESDELLGSRFEDSISTIAVGLAFELPQTQLYGLVRGRRDELSLSGIFNEEEDANSVGVEAGVRFNVTDRFEINANIGSPALDEGTSYGIGAQFLVTDNIGLTLDFNSIEVEEDDIEANFDTTSLGLRFNF
ncbi:MAG: opacity protein-like surface antigen [Arenicella sp.]|jgi:opacity protein-like surface antigen